MSAKPEETHVYLNDKTKDGWRLLQDIGQSPSVTRLDQCNIVYALTDDERDGLLGGITGRELIRCASMRANELGQYHAEWLQKNTHAFAAGPWLFTGRCIAFTGTIWVNSAELRIIPVLVYQEEGGGQWNFDFHPLGYSERFWRKGISLIRLR